jgi:hypothetical protein
MRNLKIMKNNYFNSNNRVMDNSQQVDTIPSIDEVDFHREYPFTTLDFFGVDKCNRPSEESDSTVKKYAKLMLSGEWFPELSTIYVGIHSLNIFNGEHRRKAYRVAKEKGYNPVIWVKFFDDSQYLKGKREALNGGKHWNCDDYVESLINDNKDFKFLKEFAINEDHPQLHSAKGKPYYNKAAIVLGVTYKEFKDGYLSGQSPFTNNGIARGEQTYSEMIRIKKILKYDEAGQDCWIYIGEAWHKFINNNNYWERIKRLPEGIEDFYDALKYINNTNSNKTIEWFNRFEYALKRAERKK